MFNTCEGMSLKLTCPAGYFIRIHDMFYGRLNAEVCPHASVNDTNCPSDPVNIKKLAKYCNGRSECWFLAHSSVWGDPCPNTYKSASVEFSCRGMSCMLYIKTC